MTDVTIEVVNQTIEIDLSGPVGDLTAAASVAAANSANLAQKWANEDVDVVVAGGEYSSKHYQAKAAENQADAETARDEAQGFSESLDGRIQQITGTEVVFCVRAGDSAEDPIVSYQDADTLDFMLPDPDTGVFASVQDTMKAAGLHPGTRALDVMGDPDGLAVNWTDSAGGVHLVGRPGTLQGELDAFGTTLDTALTTEQARLNATTMRAMFESEHNRAAGQTEIYFNSIVKAHGSDSTETQRIPGLCVLSTTTAFVAWQQRLAGYGYVGDAQYQRLVGALITYTPGVGVSAGSTVVIDAPTDVTKNSNHPHMFVNGDGDLVLLYNNNDHGTGSGRYKVFRRVSTDDGATWSARVDVMAPLSGGDSMAMGSNGTVEKVPTGYPNAGRWLVPVYGAGESGWFSGVIQSDDDGETWEIGPILYNGLQIQEPSIALTHEGDLLMAMRRADDPYQVHFARLPMLDGDDAEWVDMGLNALMVTATCDMSMVQIAPNVGDGVPAIAHCGPSIIARRANRIRLSYDCGRTWQWSFKRPDVSDDSPNNIGYTSIKMLDRGLFIVAYETAGSAATNSDIGIYVVNLEQVLNDGTRL